jgi:hypothetical protein
MSFSIEQEPKSKKVEDSASVIRSMASKTYMLANHQFGVESSSISAISSLSYPSIDAPGKEIFNGRQDVLNITKETRVQFKFKFISLLSKQTYKFKFTNVHTKLRPTASINT